MSRNHPNIRSNPLTFSTPPLTSTSIITTNSSKGSSGGTKTRIINRPPFRVIPHSTYNAGDGLEGTFPWDYEDTKIDEGEEDEDDLYGDGEPCGDEEDEFIHPSLENQTVIQHFDGKTTSSLKEPSTPNIKIFSILSIFSE
ncbi:LRP1B [Lepeophtheirus salmonis]|uniref:LRP1B n=1 Tax=Lepeophtheirus salmonis TaxID=72036 RepID=A0A7R8CB72_LEPSM|nr:LRP1B [Lepeophtheirus salmonis]CAF2750623.1 LRP1B [Lepeophtheirus salmonis]